MKRFHVHVGVRDLPASIRFYSALFATPPTVTKPDYAKWMLEDPRINFAISQRGGHHGVNHLGMQVDDDAELEEIHGRLDAAGAVAESDVSCCYARSDKYWIEDPQGVAWESFRSLGTVPYFGDGEATSDVTSESGTAAGAVVPAACCGPGPGGVTASASAPKSCCG